MGLTAGTGDTDLPRRVAELEARLEYLESVVLEDQAEPEALVLDNGQPEAVEPVVLAAPTPSLPAQEASYTDPRTLQVDTTADWPFLTAPAPEPPRPTFDLRDIEERLAGRALALVGGAALLLGAVFFLSLAFSRGWIGPEAQVALGLTGGAMGLLVGAVLLSRGERVVGHVLTAVGLAIVSLSLFASTSLYGLVEPALALLGVFVAAVTTTAIAIRSRSQVVAGLGLVAALAAPPILGAEPDLITVAYMAVALVGIAAVSLWQTWSWLPPLAFVLSVPQLFQWIATGPDVALSLPVLIGYWFVLIIAAGGEAFRSKRRELSITSTPLFLAVGAAVIGMGFIVLETDDQRAAFLLLLAALHGLVAANFVRQQGWLGPFGLVAGAYGTAMATAAVPLLLGAPATVVVWTAEAVTLSAFAGRRAHGPALIAALVVFGLATASLAHQALLLGPLSDVFGADAGASSIEGTIVAFAFLAAATGVSMIVVPVRSFQLVATGMLGLVALPVVPLVLDGAAAVWAWMAIAAAGIGTPRWASVLPQRPIRWRLGPALRWIRPSGTTEPQAVLLPRAAGVVAAVLGTAATVIEVVAQDRLPAIPFVDRAGLSATGLALGFVAVGIVAGGVANTRRGLFVAGLTFGLVSITQLVAPWYVLVWAALATAAAWMSRVDDSGLISYQRMALGALGMLAVLALVEAPPTRLLVEPGGVPPHPLLISDATLALASLAIAFGLVAVVGGPRWHVELVTGLAALAGATALYLLSVGVVDVFAGEVYALGDRAWLRLDELAKEAHVALSILWTVVGVVVLGLGLMARRANLRIAGLVVLGLATVKVFLFDLASLDVAYRVVTLIVLGLVLIVSAYAWSRMNPGGTAGSGGHRGPPTTPHDIGVRP